MPWMTGLPGPSNGIGGDSVKIEIKQVEEIKATKLHLANEVN
jgi:hypothetical protein